MSASTEYVEGNPFAIWPGVAPGTHVSGPEHITYSHTGAASSLRQISTPTLTPFVPKAPNGTAAIVVAGGAYSQIVIEKEGSEFASWLASLGITAFVLKYRLAVEKHHDAHLVGLQDLQRAIRVVRGMHEQYQLAPDKIGVVGCSSGAHMSACAGTRFTQQTYPGADDFDKLSARPDYMVLLYGPYSGNRRFTHASREQLFFPEPVKNRLYATFPVPSLVTHEAPPTFLATANNDKSVSAENTSALFLALRNAGVPAQLHIYEDGGHGFALRAPQGSSAATWPDACGRWLASHRFLSRKQ